MTDDLIRLVQKALNLFNAALVTPTYYVYFTSSTIVASAVLFQGFHGTATQIIDVVLGFLTICSGVVLLQLAKSSKDVPDTAVFQGDLDQVRTVAEQEEPEYEPRADTIRGGAGIVRAMSKVRTKRQMEEAKRIHEEAMEPIAENEEVEWDGLRRRRTVSSAAHSNTGSLSRRKTIHPPLGMSHFPDDVSEPDSEVHPGFFGRIGRKSQRKTVSGIGGGGGGERTGTSPVALSSVSPAKLETHVYGLPPDLRLPSSKEEDDGTTQHHQDVDTSYRGPSSGNGGPHITFAGDTLDGTRDRASSRVSSLAPPRPPPHATGTTVPSRSPRQFSFQNVFHRNRSDTEDSSSRPVSRGALSFVSRNSSHRGGEYPVGGATTEEERLGLVSGDTSNSRLTRYGGEREGRNRSESSGSEEEWQVTSEISSSPEVLGAGGDLGRGQRTRDPYGYYEDDEFYNEPLRSPTTGGDGDEHIGGRGG